MSIDFGKALGVHEQALYLRGQRAELLASNIANADTPHYQARDIDFRQALELATTQQHSQVPMARTDEQHFDIQVGAGQDPTVKYRVPYQSSLDGNTVEAHVEQAAFADNAVRYQATLTFLSGRLNTLKSILQGGR